MNLTAAQAAARLGVTIKALRVLERHGLLQPGRTSAGWRVYGPRELARVHQVLALRGLGLGLTEVAALLGGRPDLERTLALQEEALLRARADADRGLALIRRVRARLSHGEPLSVDDLIELTRETVMTEAPSPEMKALIAKHYTPEQLAELKARPFTAEDHARVSAAWADIYAQADRLAAAGADPAGAEAQALAARAAALIAEFTGGDPGIAASLAGVWREAARAPDAAQMMPGTATARDFLARARGSGGQR